MKLSLSSKVTTSAVLHLVAVVVVALANDVQALHWIATGPAWVVLAASGVFNLAGQYVKRENNPPPSAVAALVAQAAPQVAPPARPPFPGVTPQ